MELMLAGKILFWVIGSGVSVGGLTWLFAMATSKHHITTSNQDATIFVSLFIAAIVAFLGLLIPVRFELLPPPNVYEVVDLTDRTFVRLNSFTKVITDTREVAQVKDPKLQARVMLYSNLYNMGVHSKALVFVRKE